MQASGEDKQMNHSYGAVVAADADAAAVAATAGCSGTSDARPSSLRRQPWAAGTSFGLTGPTARATGGHQVSFTQPLSPCLATPTLAQPLSL